MDYELIWWIVVGVISWGIVGLSLIVGKDAIYARLEGDWE